MKQLIEEAKLFDSKGIFHRDLKLENILINTKSVEPRIWVIDFGVGCFFTKRSVYRVFQGENLSCSDSGSSTLDQPHLAVLCCRNTSTRPSRVQLPGSVPGRPHHRLAARRGPVRDAPRSGLFHHSFSPQQSANR